MFIQKNPIKFIKSVIYGRDDYSPKVKKILSQYGNQNINNIELVRTPLSEVLKFAINTASFINMENFEKSKPYDKLYHLALVCDLDNGYRVLVEKNEVINLVVNPSSYLNNDSDKLNVSVDRGITLNQLLKNTENRMGNSYFTYSAESNNCQQFIVNILRANNLNTPENEKFVFQDLKTLFKEIPKTKALIDNITELGARVDVIKQGGKAFKANGVNNALYSTELENRLSKYKNFNGVFSKDQLPSQLNNGWYIINMQNSTDGNGTHWTCFKYSPDKIIYYDPFGFIPPLEVLEKANNNILYSHKQIQNELSTGCGWFCQVCIKYDEEHNGSDIDKFKNFLKQFSTNTAINDDILKKLI